jgi:Cu2+-exporting ATPase
MHWLSITIAVLVVTCPCALSLATPAAVTAATGRLTRQGLLVTRGHVLEYLANATHVVLDKTGTLTEGIPALKDVHTFADVSAHACLNIAAALEQHSEHPLGKVIQSVADRTVKQATDVVNIPGSGVSGMIDGLAYSIGSPDYIKTSTNLALPDELDELQADGSTVVVLASQSAILAAFVMGDQLRPEAKSLVAKKNSVACRYICIPVIMQKQHRAWPICAVLIPWRGPCHRKTSWHGYTGYRNRDMWS